MVEHDVVDHDITPNETVAMGDFLACINLGYRCLIHNYIGMIHRYRRHVLMTMYTEVSRACEKVASNWGLGGGVLADTLVSSYTYNWLVRT